VAKKPAASRAKRRVPEPEPAGDGMLARLIDHTFENPAMSGGLLVMALTATAIVSNALFLQRGDHPDPLFFTRGAESRSASDVTPSARASVNATRSIDMPPTPRLSPTHTSSISIADQIEQEPDVIAAVPAEPQPMPQPPASSAPVVEEVPPAVVLLTAVQRELARLGLYSGAIDGLMGQRTAAAISAFETAAGLKPTGQPSAELLKAIRHPDAAALIAAARTQTAAVQQSDRQAEELDQRERERARMIAEQEQSIARTREAANTRIVQMALNRIGYGPLSVDGTATADTVDAIRRFELDHGMPVTGTASDALITRLIAIGAVKPG